MTIFIISEERLEQVFAPRLIREDVPSTRNLISFLFSEYEIHICQHRLGANTS